jgi:hypothetical protein
VLLRTPADMAIEQVSPVDCNRDGLTSRLKKRPGLAGLASWTCFLGGPASHATNKMHNELQLNDEATSAASISAFSLVCLRSPLSPFGLIDEELIYCCLLSPALGNASAASAPSGYSSRIPEAPVAWTPARNSGKAEHATPRFFAAINNDCKSAQ